MTEKPSKPEVRDFDDSLKKGPKLREITDEELRKILEEHKKWVETKDDEVREGQRADLSRCNLANKSLKKCKLCYAKFKGANLSKANLWETDFTGAELKGAYLFDARLRDANLEGADLRLANLREADLRNAQMRDAKLDRSNLNGAKIYNAKLRKSKFYRARIQNAFFDNAELQKAVFIKADLQGSSFKGANLQDARLSEADVKNTKFNNADLGNAIMNGVKNLNQAVLTDCNFVGAKGFDGTEFARADITRAKIPEDISGFKTQETVKETSLNARKIFLAMLLACVYSWLTIASTTDVNLLTNSASSPLPIIGTPIPIAWFYLAAPILLVGIYFYLHLYLRRYWEGLAGLPARFEDGRRLDERAYPWLLNGLVRRHFEKLKNDRTLFMKMEEWISIILAWYFMPFTLLWFWLRYLRRHDWGCTGLHIGLIILSIIAGIFFYRSHAITLRGDKADKSGDKKEDEVGKKKISLKEFLYNSRTYKYGLAIPLSVLLIILSYGAINGVTKRSRIFPIEQYSFLRVNVPKLFEFFKYDVFADFGEKTVSSRPENYWLIKPEERDNAVSGANLAYADLRHADAFMAFLDKADLREARLDAIDFRGAKLRNAYLWDASLQWAYLWNADLEGANLKRADLSNAHMVMCNLKHANLDSAIIESVYLNRANLDSASMMWANLDSVNLEEANLIGAHLQSANIWNSYLGGANLAFALLIKANIVYTNLQQVNLSSANLKSAYLERANLQSALMYDATLDSANLKCANLSGANLAYTHGLTKEQLDEACGDSLTILPDYLKDYKMKPCPCEEDSVKVSPQDES